MKLAGLGTSVFAATFAALFLIIAFNRGSDAPGEEAAIAPAATATAVAPAPIATAIPSTWLEALDEPDDAPSAVLVSCADGNGDGLLNGGDGSDVIPEGVDIALDPRQSCIAPDYHADFYPGVPFTQDGATCEGPAPVQIALVASAGSDLLQPREGESLGLIEIAKQMREQFEARGAHLSIMVAVSAIFGADPPQTSMEQFLAAHIRETLDAVPCSRVVVIGHSHGGVTATAAGMALEAEYADRMLIVLIDRSAVLYDRVALEIPRQARVVNFFQLNEGWHGVPIDQPNVENIDESDERAPIAPSDRGGGLALVSHKTLDDAEAVQRGVVERAVAWAAN